jgi:hypothetical protein
LSYACFEFPQFCVCLVPAGWQSWIVIWLVSVCTVWFFSPFKGIYCKQCLCRVVRNIDIIRTLWEQSWGKQHSAKHTELQRCECCFIHTLLQRNQTDDFCKLK